MPPCRSCGHDIDWATMEASGRPIPLDPGPVDNGNLAVVNGKAHAYTAEDEKLHRERRRSHFATCEFADQHRTRFVPPRRKPSQRSE